MASATLIVLIVTITENLNLANSSTYGKNESRKKWPWKKWPEKKAEGKNGRSKKTEEEKL